MPEALTAAALAVATPLFLWHLGLGVLLGLVVAILPGFGGTVGLALTLPFIYGMDPSAGVAVMVGLLSVVATADTFPAVLLGIPGSISGQATVVDGYPLAKQGQAARALGAAFSASLMGGLFGAVVLTAALQIARPMILAFGSGELLLLGLLGVTMVGVLSGANIVRALLAAALGLLVGTVGAAPATSVYRFEFDIVYLGAGLPLTIVVLAIFAVPELIELMGRGGAIAERRALSGGLARGLRETFAHRGLVLRSSVIGTTVGMLPGIGGSVIDWIAYGHAVQSAKGETRFGEGDIRGVIAPEAANNAKEGGALIPTMIFGIPGSGSTAVFMGGLILLGLQPGLTMVMQTPEVLYQVVWGLALANILGAGLCIALARPIASLTAVPFDVLAPILLALLMLAGYQTSRSWGDLVALLLFGLMGWLFLRHGLSRPAFVIGFVLSHGIETNLYTTLAFYGAEVFRRPVFLVLLALCALSALYGVRIARGRAQGASPALSRGGMAFVALLGAAGLAAVLDMIGERAQTRLFPQIAGGAVAALAALALWRSLRRAGGEPAPLRPALVAMGWIAALALAVRVLGFPVGAGLFALAFYAVRHVRHPALRLGLPAGLAAGSLGLSAGLGILLPEGVLDVSAWLR